MSASQLVVLVIVLLIWLAVHSGVFKWVVIAAIFNWVFG